MKKPISYFTKAELTLWGLSTLLIVVSFSLFNRESYITLAASLIGASSLILSAKGHPLGMLLMVVFSALYGIISFSFAYYGEMITYLGMTAPMSVVAFIAWLKNPYKGNKSEVTVSHLTRGSVILMLALTAAVTYIFYHILKAFDTANLAPSTLSVATSFLAVFLTAKRSPYYALCYAANDIVLIYLWTLATKEDITYLSVIICFVMFLFNDLYGFYNWNRMKKRQAE